MLHDPARELLPYKESTSKHDHLSSCCSCIRPFETSPNYVFQSARIGKLLEYLIQSTLYDTFPMADSDWLGFTHNQMDDDDMLYDS